jgi:hypothetical protein
LIFLISILSVFIWGVLPRDVASLADADYARPTSTLGLVEKVTWSIRDLFVDALPIVVDLADFA